MCGCSGLGARDTNLFVTVHNFDAFAFYRTILRGVVTQMNFVVVEFFPPVPVTIFNTALIQEIQNSLRVWVLRGIKMLNIFNNMTDRFQRVTLGMPDQTNWATFNPSGRVQSWHRLAICSQHASFSIFDNASFFIELNIWDGGTEVTDRAIHRLHRVHFHFTGATHISGTV